MKKILFATAFSNHAPEVFKYATELAFHFNAHLTVLYAYDKPEFELSNNTKEESQADLATTKMINFVTKNLPENYREHIEVGYVAKKGLSTKAVLDVALEEDIDLIVMGMTGQTNAIGSLMGSTTMGVLSKSDCPVLMVPAKAVFEGIDNLVYTTNFEFRDLGAINYLKKWARLFEAPLHCLHVIEGDENEMESLKNMNILKKTFKRHKRMTFSLVHGNLENEIEIFAKEKKADIVIMMSHKRSFITRMWDGNAVKEVAQQLPIPLLVIKDNAYELDASSGQWMKVINSIA